MKRKANAQKNTLLKNAEANAEGNFFKRVFFSPTQVEFFPPLFFLFFFHHRTGSGLNWTESASNLNRFVDNVCKHDNSPLRTDRRTSGNNGFNKLAVQWLPEVQFSNGTFVVADSFVLRNRQLLKPKTVSCNPNAQHNRHRKHEQTSNEKNYVTKN